MYGGIRLRGNPRPENFAREGTEMSSRIYIKLVDCLSNTVVGVRLSAHAAELLIEGEVFHMDVITDDMGLIELSTEFNFFKDMAHCQKLMLALFDQSIPFQVVH